MISRQSKKSIGFLMSVFFFFVCSVGAQMIASTNTLAIEQNLSAPIRAFFKNNPIPSGCRLFESVPVLPGVAPHKNPFLLYTSMNQGGLKHGPYIESRAPGIILLQGQYSNDFKSGIWTTWDLERRKQSEGNYRMGLKEGIWTEWDSNGRKTQQRYESNQVTQVITSYPDGSPFIAGSYSGVETNDRGIELPVVTGLWVTWRTNGSVEGLSKSGKERKIGSGIQYFPSGSFKRSAIVAGEAGVYDYWSRGRLLYREEFPHGGADLSSGVPYTLTLFETNGVPTDSLESTRTNKNEVCVWNRYWPSGAIRATGKISRPGVLMKLENEVENSWYIFYAGSQRTSSPPDTWARCRTGEWIEYGVDGSRSSGNYLNGKKDGAWTKWDRFDEVVGREVWKDGILQ